MLPLSPAFSKRRRLSQKMSAKPSSFRLFKFGGKGLRRTLPKHSQHPTIEALCQPAETSLGTQKADKQIALRQLI